MRFLFSVRGWTAAYHIISTALTQWPRVCQIHFYGAYSPFQIFLLLLKIKRGQSPFALSKIKWGQVPIRPFPPPHRFVQMADFACENGQPSNPSRIRFCPMRFHCVINREVSYLVFSVWMCGIYALLHEMRFHCVIISEVSIQRFRMRWDSVA